MCNVLELVSLGGEKISSDTHTIGSQYTVVPLRACFQKF